MDFSYSDEQAAAIDLARQILTDHCTPKALRALDLAGGERFDRALYGKLAEAGILAAGLPEEHGAHRVLLEVHGDPGHPVGELEELARHAILEAVDAGDPVAHLQHGAHLADVHRRGVARELLANDLRDLVGANLHVL